MADLDLSALRGIAEAATPGEWVLDMLGEDEPQIGCWAQRFIGTAEPNDAGVHVIVARAEDGFGPNATHIAAFDPPTVVALLSRLEAAERVIALAKDHAIDLLECIDYDTDYEDGAVSAVWLLEVLSAYTRGAD